MSWLRSAMNKAAEVGNNSNLTRTVKNYADSVVQQAGQAVAEGAKLLQDRIGGRNNKSFKQTVKSLEEASVSCGGKERVELMSRWLALLKEFEISSSNTFEDGEKNNEQHQFLEEPKTPSKQSMDLYYDSDMDGEPWTFHDVFLYSQALEGISISMILIPPSGDEVSLLLELFGLCLTGGKEVHHAIVSSIQDLAKVFSRYQYEVLVKREELLQFAERAITGLKINADIHRIDAEVLTLKKQLESRASCNHSGEIDETNIKQTVSPTIEGPEEALKHIRACSRLEAILLKKKAIKYGDTSEIHSQKIDKLKILIESLTSSSSKSEKRISDFSVQKEDALMFRMSKVTEVSEIEKELADEISVLEKQRDELLAQLKVVNTALTAAQARLRNATEERDQFFDANDQVFAHLKAKEDELVRTIRSCQTEADILSVWINFLEDTWSLQSSYVEAKEKETNDEIERHEYYFTDLVEQLLSSYEKELRPHIDGIGKYVDNLKSLTNGSASIPVGAETDGSQMVNPRRHLEEEYLDYEAKIIATFSVVDHMKEQFYAQKGTLSSKENQKIKELFEAIEKLRGEFESIERPTLELENPPNEVDAYLGDGELMLNPQEELAKLESQFGRVYQQYYTEEFREMELEALERELKSSGR